MENCIIGFVANVEILRENLGPDGKYSICREDGTPLGIGDIMHLGDLFQRIDTGISLMKDLQKCEGI